MADFRESGADLPPDQRERLEAIEAELAEVTQKYSENVLDATNAWELVIEDEARLAGLPASAKDAARASATAKGHGSPENPAWRFTLHMPSYGPLMEHLADAAIREQAWRAMAAVGRADPTTTPRWSGESSRCATKRPGCSARTISPTSSCSGAWPETAAPPSGSSKACTTASPRPTMRNSTRCAQWRAKASGTEPEPMEPWDIGLLGRTPPQGRIRSRRRATPPVFPDGRGDRRHVPPVRAAVRHPHRRNAIGYLRGTGGAAARARTKPGIPR